MTYNCAFCDKPEYMPKWFGCPGTVWRPNQYSVCEEHQEMSLRFEDVYLNDCDLPVTRHEDKVSMKDED